jgi:Zn-dependent metalloprotease
MIKLLQKRVVLPAMFCLQGLTMLNAQSTQQQIVGNLTNDQRVKEFTMESLRGTPSLITMKTSGTTLSRNDVPAFLKSVLGLGESTTFVNVGNTSSGGIQVDKYQQYNNGIKVQHGVFKAISSKNIVQGFSAEFYNLPSISANPSLNESAALQKALAHVGATTYAWDYVKSLGNSPEITAAYNELYPKGELVMVDNYMTPEVDLSLAYKFNVYAVVPLSRAYIYVDANNGQILLLDAIIKHADASHGKEDIAKIIKPAAKVANPQPLFSSGIGDTRFAGRRSFDTSMDAEGRWVLKGITPSGIANETLSYEGLGGTPLSVPGFNGLAMPIIDGDSDLLFTEVNDNIWNAAEHRKDRFSTTNRFPVFSERNNDDVALDAHWGAEVVLDYWKNIHARFSYDNKGTKVFNYVHYGDGYDNAFWNGTAMTYGDGSYQGGTNPNAGSFAPLTSMDVCAHEIGHGVCEFTADLVYQRESGAMNEGFSDIWAASVENYVLKNIDGSLPYDPWGIGEQIDERDGGLPPGQALSRALRWMDDPKAATAPDSYGGLNWREPECGTPTLANDQCGVHTNSGVLNKWYYLMVTGSGKAFSPGRLKKAADDEITDKGNTYKVLGIGYDKADKITYLAETMLTPNAKFAEMRNVSILAAQMLYGIASIEEQQTTNAWHGVDVGSAYNAGEPNNISFSSSNVQILTEKNQINGCEDLNSFNVVVTGVAIAPSATINLSLAGSTATLGQDFTVSTQTLTFTGSQTQTITINVIDDAIIEGNETIVLSFLYNGKLVKQEFTISDDDFIPRTGKQPIELLAKETFSVAGLPAGWATVNSTGTNKWSTNGNLSGAGRAFITDGISNTPMYDTNAPSNTTLRSPLINAAGTSNVTVSFDWEAGGEIDAVEPTIFDFGEFVYSTDGSTYIPVRKFHGNAPIGVSTASGKYTGVFNNLDGQSFFIGWRWFNDTNAGSPFSFAIDNVVVTALPAGIETEKGDIATTKVYSGNSIYFVSSKDQALIARIENASADLGCVTISVVDEGTSVKTFSKIATTRAAKVLNVTTANATATYDLTVYYTNAELSGFANPTVLKPLKVNGSNIDDANDRPNNFDYNGVITDVNTEGEFKAFTGRFSGSGVISVVKDFDFCSNVPAPWATSDVGTVGKAAAVCFKNGNFEVTASGNGIESRSDSFSFTYQQLTGDGEIIAKVNSLGNTNKDARAAIMIRESLNSNSKFAMTAITANPNFTGTATNFEYRKAAGDKSKITNFASTTLPKYLRLVRKGNLITSFISNTNGNWIMIGSTSEVQFGQTVYIGLATASNYNPVTTVANYSDVTIITNGATAKSTQSSAKTGQSPVVQEDATLTSFAMYPNPVVNSLNIELSDSSIQSVGIFSFLGKTIRNVNMKSASQQVALDVTNLPKGLYVLKISTTDGQVLTKSFLKE